jgi:hypothetical protein
VILPCVAVTAVPPVQGFSAVAQVAVALPEGVVAVSISPSTEAAVQVMFPNGPVRVGPEIAAAVVGLPPGGVCFVSGVAMPEALISCGFTECGFRGSRAGAHESHQGRGRDSGEAEHL